MPGDMSAFDQIGDLHHHHMPAQCAVCPDPKSHARDPRIRGLARSRRQCWRPIDGFHFSSSRDVTKRLKLIGLRSIHAPNIRKNRSGCRRRLPGSYDLFEASHTLVR